MRVIGSHTISTSLPRSAADFRSVNVTVAIAPPCAQRRFGIIFGRIGSSASALTLVTSRAVDTPARFSGCACRPTSWRPGSGPCFRRRSSPRIVTLLPEYLGLPFPFSVTLSSCIRYGMNAPSMTPRRVVPGVEARARVPPLRFLVNGLFGEPAECPDDAAHELIRRRGHLAAGRLVHERHELVGEAGHRAPDADAADVGTAADAVHPSALGDVAADDGAPAADLHETLRRAVLVREVALLVVAGTIASFVHRAAEQPGGAEVFIQRNDRRLSTELIKQIQERLGHVVRLDRAAGHAHDRQAGFALPRPSEIVGNAHRAGGIAGHRVNAAVGGAGSHGDDRGPLRGEPIEPLRGLHRLIREAARGGRAVAEARPVPPPLDPD